MNDFPLSRRLAAEALGTALLLAAVVGSGIMAERLSGGNAAIALLANTLATFAALYVLILCFGPISGAQFNPAVSLFLALRRELPWRDLPVFALAQIAGGILGVWLAHGMFGEAIWQTGIKPRGSGGEILSEAVATFGLILTIALTGRFRAAALPFAVAGYIAAAYWFTASTSFANPAAAIARGLTASFANIRPGDVPAFIGAELAGMLAAAAILAWLIPSAFTLSGESAASGHRATRRAAD